MDAQTETPNGANSLALQAKNILQSHANILESFQR